MIYFVIYAITYHIYGSAAAIKVILLSAGFLFLKWVHTGEIPEGEIE